MQTFDEVEVIKVHDVMMYYILSSKSQLFDRCEFVLTVNNAVM